MAQLETQVVKIQLGDRKQATSYIYTLAETVENSQSELYLICELPLFNPAAADECQRIAEAIAGALRRTYRRSVNPDIFEHSLTIINEELGKLQNLGKAHWIGKLNAIVAVKTKNKLSVASVGKMTALLYRDKTFLPVAEPNIPTHPLKTFENFSEGKLQLGDLLVFSTAQLFNHISIDRFKNLVQRDELPEVAKEVIAILQEAMGPEVACGTILAEQVVAGINDTENEVELNAYTTAPTLTSHKQNASISARIQDLKTTTFRIGKNVASSVGNSIKQAPQISGFLKGQGKTLDIVQTQFKKATQKIQPQAIKNYSRQKKIFLATASILLLVVIANIVIAKYVYNKPAPVIISETQISDLEKLINDANSTLLYGDEVQAKKDLEELQGKLASLNDSNIPADIKPRIDKIKEQVSELSNKLNNVVQAKVKTLGTLSSAEHLITLPNFFATENGRTIVSYNRTSKSVQDNALHTSESILQSAYAKANQAVIYNGKELLLWNFQTGIIGKAFDTEVPTQNQAVGLTSYNNRVYLLNKNTKKVMRFDVGTSELSNPTVSIETNNDFASASDIAIDGNIYIATNGTILKYNSGTKQEFSIGLSNLSDKTKLFTDANVKNIYVLDPPNKRIVVLSKEGAIVQTLASSEFNDLKDFAVDEASKTIYVLNNNQLLQVDF